MRDVIFVSLEDWDEIWRRNQFVCELLAKRHPSAGILFVGPPRNLPRSMRRGEFRALFAGPGQPAADLPNITTTSPWQLLPNRYGWSRRVNEWLMRTHVRQAARRLKFSHPLLWLNPHDAVHMVGKMDEAAVIYDVTDDWIELEQPAAKKRLTIQQDAELCRKASAVIVCSEALRQRRETLAGKIHLIPNGVDAAHYARVSDGAPPPPESAAWPKPVLAYTGTLHGERLDVELVRQIAGTPGVGSVVLVGPNHLSGHEIERLRLPNVFPTGPVAYARLPDLMRAFDACIVPHLITPFTESLNPIKLWEYLAVGKPIIATPVAGFRDFPQFVYLFEDRRGFANALGAALTENSALPALRRAEAAKHSWSARVEAIEKILSALPGRTFS